jgi:hypothetical protein
MGSVIIVYLVARRDGIRMRIYCLDSSDLAFDVRGGTVSQDRN